MEFPEDTMTQSKSSYLYASVESIMNFLRLTLSIFICIKIIIIYKIKIYEEISTPKYVEQYLQTLL